MPDPGSATIRADGRGKVDEGNDIARYRANLHDELEGAALYSAMCQLIAVSLS